MYVAITRLEISSISLTQSGYTMLLKSHLFVFFSIVLLTVALPLHAYTDPGTGSLILQLLIAGFAGSLFYVRKIYRVFSNYFTKKCHTPTIHDK